MMRPFAERLLFAVFLISTLLCNSAAYLQVHDASFEPDYVLQITAGTAPVACQSRYSVLVNGSSPGPTLYLKEGRTTWIRVYNMMSDQNLTIHWHGLSERTAPFSDGTPQASQWPIAPAQYFDYELHPERGDAGTYFYHSHIGFQAVSAYGPLVVEDSERPPYQYQDDIILAMGDYYNKTDLQVEPGLLATPFKWSGESLALLMNGHSGTAGTSNATDNSCTPYIIHVKPDTTYRMRFIGGTAISLATLGIEGHSKLTIIEADGAYTKPFVTDHIQIASGQRFSVLFKTKSLRELQADARSSYWIRYENRARPTNISGYAVLAYDIPGSSPNTYSHLPLTAPITLPSTISNWLEYSLSPLNPAANPFPRAAEVTRTVTITVQQIINGSLSIASAGTTNISIEWAENGDTWQQSRVQTPYLVSIYQRGDAAIPSYSAALANGGWDPATLAFPAKIGEVMDIVWQNDNGPLAGWDVHPFHAHGRHYWDLGSGNGTYDAAANEARLAGFEPATRDTTMLYSYSSSKVPYTVAGWRAWRLRVTEPGVWMIHCHILAHMIMGMQTAWVFGNASQITAASPEPFVAGYLNYGGSAYGNASYDPLVNHYF